MAVMALKEQLDSFVKSMLAEGTLDQQFQQLQMLEDGSGFVAEVIKMFCDDSERILGELTNLLEQVVVDFGKVDGCVHQLKGSSSSIGAHNVTVACVQFRHFCDENDKEGCLRALNVLKHEFYRLQSKFQTMSQMENRILAYEGRKANGM
ncbi:histidine-containing phosphotransfer protein 2-like isoform X1 [Iris pallida]|uniref:Histidine-containing phosphotransfer protein n=1 Tax=Iris pallida TaxID=29817 RepID=A0AAX6G7L9_IRIPA|nr:histidine-containing phosphotransfer protein 2-like isoform X1 [Iris pallida]